MSQLELQVQVRLQVAWQAQLLFQLATPVLLQPVQAQVPQPLPMAVQALVVHQLLADPVVKKIRSDQRDFL